MTEMPANNFCALPFHHVRVSNNGDYDICCKHSMPDNHRMNISDAAVDQWLDSPYVQQVRESFLQDNKHPGCSYCWQKESAGLISHRQQTTKEFEILGISTKDCKITHAEISTTNLCNLTCVMCNEKYSSAIQAENIKLGLHSATQDSTKWTATAYNNLKDLLDRKPKIVALMGGEPLYNKKFLQLVKDIDTDSVKKMALHINTNATVWNDDWQQALEKFSLVRFVFSVDAVGDLFEYIRYPAKWETVQKNIDQIRRMPNTKCSVNCVVQNLNVSHLGELIDWCASKSLWLNFEVINQPRYLELTNLGPEQRELALANLNKIQVDRLNPSQKQVLDRVQYLLQTSDFEPKVWADFEKIMRAKDSVRGNNYSCFIK